MKKTITIFTIVMLCVVLSPKLEAQEGTSANFYLNFGIMTDDSFKFDPFYWYMGGNLDIHLGEYLMLSPEANLITYNFNFETFLLEPALLLNVKLGTMFVGGGIAKLFILGGEETFGSDLFLKLNVGFSDGSGVRLKLFANMLFDNLFKNMLIGAQIGIGF